jgi:CheY-like chemotaxis protein
MNVLLAISNPAYAAQLSGACQHAGYATQVIAGGLFALTLLERMKPDVVISDSELEDMSGQDFYEIVRSDTSLDTVRFILLDTGALVEKGDATLPAQSPIPTVMQTVAHLLSQQFPKREGVLESPSTRAHQHMSGTLEIITLYDLIVSLTQNNRSSKLWLTFPDEALIVTYEGQVIHAMFRQKIGMSALLEIFRQNEQTNSAGFVVETLESADIPKVPRTIHKPVSQLLLEIAVELDHLRERLKVKGR